MLLPTWEPVEHLPFHTEEIKKLRKRERHAKRNAFKERQEEIAKKYANSKNLVAKRTGQFKSKKQGNLKNNTVARIVKMKREMVAISNELVTSLYEEHVANTSDRTAADSENILRKP